MQVDSKIGKAKSLTLNFIMNAILTLSSMIFPLLTFPYVSRILSPIGIGKVSFAISLISYFNMLAQLGIPTYGVRVCSQVRDDKEKLSQTVQELLIINIVASIISYLFFALSLITIPRLFGDRKLYLLISGTILFNVIGIEWMYRALEQYTYITIRSVVFKLVATLAMFVLIHEENDYIIYGVISVFAASASNALNFINARKYISFKPLWGYSFKKHIKPILVFFSMSCATSIYTNLDTIMLGFMSSDAEVGYYNAAIKVKIILVSIITSLGTVLLPRSSYYIEKKQIFEFKKISTKALNFVVLFSIPLTVYFSLFAKEVIFFLSGDAYIGAVTPMRIIMPTLILIGLTNIIGLQVLVPLGKEKFVLYSEIAGALTDLILNALLIPYFAAIGAAIGTLVAEIVVLLFQFFALKNKIGEVFTKIRFKYCVISVLAAGIISEFARRTLTISFKSFQVENFLILTISFCLFCIVYGVLLLLFREPLLIEICTSFFRKIDKFFKSKNCI